MNSRKKIRNRGEQALEKSVCSFNIFVLYALTLIMTLGMMVLIFYFSGENADLSSDLSGGICEKLMDFLNNLFHLGWDEIKVLSIAEFVETPVRKCAHFTEYALLSICVNLHGLSIMRMKKKDIPFEKTIREQFLKLRLWVLRSCLFCIAYSVSDELHQSFVPGRACRFFDVCVDTSGILFGAGLVLFVLWFMGRYKKGKKEKIRNRFVY